jgi:hypothetical protein
LAISGAAGIIFRGAFVFAIKTLALSHAAVVNYLHLQAIHTGAMA